MEKFLKRRSVITALIFSLTGSADHVQAVNTLPTRISEQIMFIRQFAEDQKADIMSNSDSLIEIIPQRSDDETAWRKTWHKLPTFSENFGDFWS